MPDLVEKMDDDVLIKVEHVSKKFCRSLKRSLWYGTLDVANALLPWKKTLTPEQGRGDVEYPLPPLRTDEFWAVRDVSFEVRRGECLGLIGHNGAGKSTLLKMLNSLNRPDAGRITMRGRIGALIELGAGFNPILTGRENIYNQAALIGYTKEEIDTKFDAIVSFSELEKFLEMPVQNYSSGMKIRLGFSVAAMMEPDIFLLDEVLAVGDIGFTLKCLNRIGEIMPNTATIFVSHNLQQVARVCNSVLLLESGQPKLLTESVAEGIQSYLALYSGLKSMDLGNGAILVKSLRMDQIDQKEVVSVSETAPFENGNTLSIQMSFDVKSAPDEDVFAIIKIYDQQLRECVNSFSHDASGQTFKMSKFGLQVRANLPSLYLNRGLHYLSISVEGMKTRKIYCHATNIKRFTVRSSIQGWATSTVPGDWRIIQ